MSIKENNSGADYGRNPKVNLKTGKLLYEIAEIGMGGGSYGVALSHIYNSELTDEFGEMFAGMSGGWKLDVQCYVKKESAEYKYVDGSGTEHRFVLFDSEAGRYYDETDAGVVLKEHENGTKTITDGMGNQMWFDVFGRLYKLVSCQNKTIAKYCIYDDTGRLIKVYDGRYYSGKHCGAELKLGYGADGLLSDIRLRVPMRQEGTAQDSATGETSSYQYTLFETVETILFTYENGRLSKITQEVQEKDSANLISQTLAEYGYTSSGQLAEIKEPESKSGLKITYDETGRVNKLENGVYDVEESFHVKNSTAYVYPAETGNESETTVTNENGITISYFLDQKGRIVSQFEKASNELKTLKAEVGKKLSLNDSSSLSVSGQRINGEDTFTVNGVSFSVSDFNLSHYDKDENKYFDCSFWLKHSLNEERLKIKFEYKLTGDTAYRTQYVWINGRAKDAWQKVSALLTLDESEGSFDASALTECCITLCYASGANAGSFVMSHLLFNPAPKIVFSVRDGSKTFALDSVDRFNAVARGTTYEITDNRTATDTYLTENDVIRSLMNKFARFEKIGNLFYFDIICNDGTKRLSQACGFVFEQNNVNCSLTDVSFPIVTETTMPTNKVRVEQYYHFEEDQFTLTSYNHYRENGMQGENSDKDKNSTNVEVYNYYGQKKSVTDEYGVKTEYEYDKYGQPIRVKTVASDGTIGEVSERDYDDDKENVATSWSGFASANFSYLSPFALLHETRQNSYDSETDTYVNTNDKQKTTYNAFRDKVQKVAQYKGCCKVTENEVTYADGRIRTVSNGTETYGAIHDFVNDTMKYTCGSGNNKRVLQTDTIVKDGTDKVHTSTFNGNDNSPIATTVDKYDRVKSIAEGGVTKVTYTYQSGGESAAVQKIASVSDAFEDKVTTYQYDSYRNLYGWSQSSRTNGDNHLTVEQITAGDTKYTFGTNEKYCTKVFYDSDKVMAPRITATGIAYDPNTDADDDFEEIAAYRKNYTYDSLGRLIEKSCENSDCTITEEISYVTLGQSNTSIPKSTSYKLETPPPVHQALIMHDICRTEQYAYDKRGNISTVEINCQATGHHNNGTDSIIFANEIQTKSYAYDELNRLTCENDSLFGLRKYTYGSNGKIETIEKDEVVKSFEYDDNGQLKSFVYNDKEQMKSYDRVNYTYDYMGNRKQKTKANVSIQYGYTRGNLLQSIGTGITYAYNSDGVRYQKTVNGVTTTYYLDGNKILGEDRGTGNDKKSLRYFYDIDGLCGIRYNGTNYRVVRNAYGDVVMIVQNNVPVARYYYDAWGNCEVRSYMTDEIGTLNPFRWKGHYFDTESGLYYANGSYYDPEVGLHVDAASIATMLENAFTPFGLDRNGIMCDNVLAYLPYVCSIFPTLELSANPLYDPDFNKPWWELAWNAVGAWFASIVQWYNSLEIGWKIGVGAALLAIAFIITAVGTVGTGGTGAAALAAVGNVALQFLIGVASGMAMSMVMTLITGGDIGEALLQSFADGVLWGGVFAFVSAGVNAVKTGVRAVRNAKLAGSSQTGAQPCSTVNQCFQEGTLVETEAGLKPIEEIQVGDKVLAYDEETGRQAYRAVVRLFRNTTEEWYHIHVNGEEIVCTGGHPFYEAEFGKFLLARELKIGNTLLCADGSCAIIQAIQIEKPKQPETTYNFEVEEFHTYYVTDCKILAHNKCREMHHFLTNKNKEYTEKFEEILDKYHLDLDGDWNKELLPHRGRHAKEYHEFMLKKVKHIDDIAKGNVKKFLKK